MLPTRSPGRTAQVNTIRLGLIKLGARVKQLKNRIRVYRPTADPNQPILRLVHAAGEANLIVRRQADGRSSSIGMALPLCD